MDLQGASHINMETWFKPKPFPSQDWENNRKVDGVALIIICDSNMENCSKQRVQTHNLCLIVHETVFRTNMFQNTFQTFVFK